jgi:SSS family solute:Na+ symporter
MGTVFFLVSLAMAPFLGVDIYTVLIVLGVAIIVLTLMGGIEAVIWMDVIQGFLLIGGGIICALLLLFKTAGGPAEVFQIAGEYHKISFAPYTWEFTQLTFFVMIFNGFFYAIQKYCTDQTIVQRYLTAKDDRSAKKAAYIGVFLSVPIWALFMFIGTALFAFYHATGDPTLPAGLKGEEVFPYFMATELPVGVVGLIVAALAAAAISSLDSDMNCLAAIGVQDYYARFKPKSTDKQRLRVGRWLVFASGIASVGVGMLYAYWGGEGVLGVVFGLYAIFSAGIVGLFLLGLFSRRANKQGLYVGIAAAILFTAYAVLTSTKFDFGDGAGKRVLLDLGSWNFHQHKYMLGVYSHIVLFVVGYIASFFFKAPLADKDLTIYGYFERRKAERC